MSELTVKEVEVVRDIPGNPPEKGGPAKVLRVHLEGDERAPELFATAKTSIPSVGSKVDDSRLTFNKQWDRWEFVKEAKAGGGGFKRSPEESRKITRMHSQEMALMEQAAIIASGGRPFTEEQMKEQIGWWEADALAKQKQGVVFWPLNSDVPFDDDGMVGG